MSRLRGRNQVEKFGKQLSNLREKIVMKAVSQLFLLGVGNFCTPKNTSTASSQNHSTLFFWLNAWPWVPTSFIKNINKEELQQYISLLKSAKLNGFDSMLLMHINIWAGTNGLMVNKRARGFTASQFNILTVTWIEISKPPFLKTIEILLEIYWPMTTTVNTFDALFAETQHHMTAFQCSPNIISKNYKMKQNWSCRKGGIPLLCFMMAIFFNGFILNFSLFSSSEYDPMRI